MSYLTEVLADSPLIYWRLNESSGTTATDSSGNARSGTLTASGITYSQTGAVAGDNALLFNGSSGALSLSTAINWDTYSALTIEFWFSTGAFNNTDDMAWELTATGSNASGGISIDPCDSTGTFAVRMKATTGSNEKRYTRPSTGSFHHYAFVIKKNTQTNAVVGYLDGSLWTPSFTNEAFFTEASFPISDKCYVMSRNAASLFLNGTMDEVAVYPSDIGAARVAAHFSAASGAASGTTRSLLGVGT